MSLINRVAKFASSPQGRQLVERGKQMAKDPETRRKLDRARTQLAGKRGGGR